MAPPTLPTDSGASDSSKAGKSFLVVSCALAAVLIVAVVSFVAVISSIRGSGTARSGRTFDFRGVKIGDTRPAGFPEMTRISAHGEEIQVFCGFIDGNLERVELFFPSKLFDDLVAVYSTKFGDSPDRTSEEPASNRLGEKFLNRIVSWETSKGTFQLERYATRSDMGMGSIESKKYRDLSGKSSRESTGLLRRELGSEL